MGPKSGESGLKNMFHTKLNVWTKKRLGFQDQFLLKPPRQ